MSQRVLFRYRITFTKLGKCRFLGHLDLQTLFQRAIKRAGLPVAYSEGFNPHQLLSFAQPLSLGYSGLAELLEAEMLTKIDVAEAASKLSEQMPKGMEVVRVTGIELPSKPAAALIEKAVYKISFPDDNKIQNNFQAAMSKIMSGDKALVLKKGKRDLENVRAHIFALDACINSDKPTLKATLAAGSSINLRPDLVAQLILENIGIAIDNADIDFCREEIILRG